MTEKERTNKIIDVLLVMRRESCRTMARLKAFESVMAESVPSSERFAWYERIDRQSDRCLQDVLEEFEKRNPGFAALLDNRSPEELRGLE